VAGRLEPICAWYNVQASLTEQKFSVAIILAGTRAPNGKHSLWDVQTGEIVDYLNHTSDLDS
jgi:hypothetical protein